MVKNTLILNWVMIVCQFEKLCALQESLWNTDILHTVSNSCNIPWAMGCLISSEQWASAEGLFQTYTPDCLCSVQAAWMDCQQNQSLSAAQWISWGGKQTITQNKNNHYFHYISHLVMANWRVYQYKQLGIGMVCQKRKKVDDRGLTLLAALSFLP